MNPGWVQSKTFRIIVIVKTVFLFLLWLSLDQFKMGDMPSFAEDKPAKEQENHEASPSKEAKSAEDVATTPKRRSFLDNLLNLPEIDPKKLQREEAGRFLALAERKKKQLDERLEMLKTREVQLKKIESDIDGKLKRLDEERKFFAQTVQQEKELKGQRLDRLVELYDKMEPKKAAPVIEKLDKDLVVALFKRLKQKQVTTILEFMNPEKSVQLSEYYGRVRSGREYDLLREMNVSLRKEFAECKGMPQDTQPADDEPNTSQEGPKQSSATPEQQIENKAAEALPESPKAQEEPKKLAANQPNEESKKEESKKEEGPKAEETPTEEKPTALPVSTTSGGADQETTPKEEQKQAE